MQGKLLEVDLGDEVRNRNANMTDRAWRQLQGEKVDDEAPAGPPKKVRLGRDGKPWRPRNRRDSDAIKRDQLVEELMRENRREWSPLTRVIRPRSKANPVSQSTCTRHRKPRRPALPRRIPPPPMIASRKSFGESSWTPWPRGKRGGKRQRRLPNQVPRRTRMSSGGPSWEEAGIRVRPCGISC